MENDFLKYFQNCKDWAIGQEDIPLAECKWYLLAIKPGRASKFVSNLLWKLSGFLLIFQGSILLLPQSSITMYLKNIFKNLDKREELMEHSPAKNLFTAIVVLFSVSHRQY